MKRMKVAAACVLAAILVLALNMSVYAASGDADDPYDGGHDYGHADDGSIVLHKLNMTEFERTKAAELITAGTLPAGGTVTFTPNVATGAALNASDVVGTYVTTASQTPVNVTLGELKALGNIVFKIEQVKLIAGKATGSHDPGDYEVVPGGISGHAKTDATTGLINWTGLAESYYKITELSNTSGTPQFANPFVISLPMVDPSDPTQSMKTIHIYPKNITEGPPFIEKEAPSLDDFNGNVLTWHIKAEVPASLKTPKGNQSYIITDTLGDGLEYRGNLRVFYTKNTRADTVTLVEGDDYTHTATTGSTSITITLEEKGYAKLAAAIASGSPGDIDKQDNKYMLYVDYDTVVNISEADFTAGILPDNTVSLEFINNDGNTYNNNPGPTDLTDAAAIKITKLDGADGATKLAGAEFQIYTALNNQDVDPSSILMSPDGKTPVTITSNDQGTAFYAGLGKGTYYIVESKAPTGFKQLTGHIAITITEANVTGNAVLTSEVLNFLDNGVTLPATGGPGTILFIVIGIGLIIAAAIVFFVSRNAKKPSDTNQDK